MVPKDVMKWGKMDWVNKVRYVAPSGGGAVGVMFVWLKSEYGSGLDKPSGPASFIVKPIQGSAAPTRFSESILSKIGKANSPNSQALSKGSGGYEGIQTLVVQYKKFADSDRWKVVAGHYTNADSFLVQENAGGDELEDLQKIDGEIPKMLRNRVLMGNLGRLFVADAMIGNGDRLLQMNAGNIMFKPDGTVCAIDSSTVLTNYREVLNDTTDQSKGQFVNNMTPSNWAKNVIVQGETSVPTAKQKTDFAAWQNDPANNNMPTLAPSFMMKKLFDRDTWWTSVFRSVLTYKLVGQTTQPSETDWTNAKKWFDAGVEAGMKDVDKQLATRSWNWLKIKQSYNGFVKKHGKDANLDWTNFKTRRMYYKLRRAGKTNDQAMVYVDKYMAKKNKDLTKGYNFTDDF